ncbi:MAG: hypothetical protein GXP33_13145 [Spirochaetes bacterium]|nr:hypothetical protein [Spirochaetota bacterium]
MKYTSCYFKKIIVLLVFSIILFSVYPEDLNWFFDTALNNDRQLKILKIELENIRLSIKKSNLDSVFSVTLSAQDTGVSYSWATERQGSGLLLSSTPSVVVRLASPWETQITASSGISVNAGSKDGASGAEFYPGLAVKQPLNKLIGLEDSTELADLTNRISVKQAEIKIAERKTELKQKILEKLKSIYSAEKNLKNTDIQIMDAQKAFDDVVKLKSYDKGSSRYKQLKYNVMRLKRQKESAAETIGYEREGLKNLVGSSFTSLPGEIPEVDLNLPSMKSVSLNPDVYLSGLRLLSDSAELKERITPDVPGLSAGASIKRTGGSKSGLPGTGTAETDIAGTFEGIFDNISVSAAIGSNLNSKTLYLTAGITWSLPDNRAKEIEETVINNNIKSDRLELNIVKENYSSAIEKLKAEIKDLENRTISLKEDMEIAELQLKEAETQYGDGMISSEDLKNTRWQADSLSYDKKLLLLDRMIASEEINGLILAGESDDK